MTNGPNISVWCRDPRTKTGWSRTEWFGLGPAKFRNLGPNRTRTVRGPLVWWTVWSCCMIWYSPILNQICKVINDFLNIRLFHQLGTNSQTLYMGCYSKSNYFNLIQNSIGTVELIRFRDKLIHFRDHTIELIQRLTRFHVSCIKKCQILDILDFLVSQRIKCQKIDSGIKMSKHGSKNFR